MSSNSIRYSDRCSNPYGLSGHKGNNLRPLSKSLRDSFPNLSTYAKICSDCRKRNGRKNSICSLPLNSACSDLSQSVDHDMDVDNSMANSSTTSPSPREVELEDMLNGLKEKFSMLEITDPLRLRILTIAPETWSVNKLANEFNCSWKFAKKAKELKASEGVLSDTTAKKGRALKNVLV